MRFYDRLYSGYRPPERKEEEDRLADEVKDDPYWQHIDKQLELWKDEQMIREKSNVFHTSPHYDSAEIVHEKPPIPDSYCKRCCRLLRWYKNPNETNPSRWQSVCCGRPYYEEVRDGKQ